MSASGITLLGTITATQSILSFIGRNLGLPAAPLRKWANLLSGVLIIEAWILSGFRLGLFRPIGVLFLRALAKRFGFRFRAFAPLLIELALEALLSLFWHEGPFQFQSRIRTALAVSGAVLLYSREFPISRGIGSWALLSLWDAATTRLFSLSLPFLSVSLLPIVGLILFPALLFESMGIALGFPPSSGLSSLLTLFNSVTRMGVGISLQLPTLWVVEPFALLLGISLSSLCLVIRKKKHLGLCFGLVCLGSRAFVFGFTKTPELPKLSRPEAERVIQLDIGQGDSALVIEKTPSGKVSGGLIDTGPRAALDDADWIRILADQALTGIDWIAVTHLDADHVGGIDQLARIAPIRCIEVSFAELETERGKADAERWRKAGIRVGSPCTPYPKLHPGDPGTKRSLARSPNNSRMSAYLIPFRGADSGFYLSAGDAESPDEPAIARWAIEEIRRRTAGLPFLKTKRRIVKLCHHGSHTSTSKQWLDLLQPTEAWISAGIGNTYGHPHAETLERVRLAGIRSRRTDRDGALSSDALVETPFLGRLQK